MDPRDIRRWNDNYRAAAARERSENAKLRLPASEAFASALALLVLDEQLNGNPFDRHDSVSDREDEAARHSWSQLRKKWHRVR